MVGRRSRALNFALQAGKLTSYFPASTSAFSHNRLEWEHTIIPSPLSRSYEVRIAYMRDRNPDVYVLTKLELYDGMTTLPHVYNTDEQRLCLYYRKGREWNSSMFLADTIVPWTSEWLFHYECWLGTGIWHGGGIHCVPENHQEDLTKNVSSI